MHSRVESCQALELYPIRPRNESHHFGSGVFILDQLGTQQGPLRRIYVYGWFFADTPLCESSHFPLDIQRGRQHPFLAPPSPSSLPNQCINTYLPHICHFTYTRKCLQALPEAGSVLEFVIHALDAVIGESRTRSSNGSAPHSAEARKRQATMYLVGRLGGSIVVVLNDVYGRQPFS